MDSVIATFRSTPGFESSEIAGMHRVHPAGQPHADRREEIGHRRPGEELGLRRFSQGRRQRREPAGNGGNGGTAASRRPSNQRPATSRWTYFSLATCTMAMNFGT